MAAFEQQVEWALEFDLPIVVHTRDAWDDMCAVAERFAGRGVRGVFHAFSSDAECYRRLKACGDFCFGVGGVVTFKKSALAKVVAEMDLEDLVIETDAPYLTPVPHRGERNESSYVRFVCAKIAEIKGVSRETVFAVTKQNAKNLYKI